MFETRSRNLMGCACSGLIAGLVFGIIVGFAGILPNIAGIVGSSSPVIGFIVNLIVSVIVALAFIIPFGQYLTNFSRAAVAGLIYGLVWWVLGPLILMPMLLGMGPQLSVEAASQGLPIKLGSHLIYGLLVGLSYFYLTTRYPHVFTDAAAASRTAGSGYQDAGYRGQ